MKKTNILTVSIIAMMAVGAARADIASTNYVNAQIQPVSQQASANASAIAELQDNMITQGEGTDINSDVIGALQSDEVYLSGKAVDKAIANRLSSYTGQLTTAEQDISDLASGKADKATGLTGATKTKITYNNQGIVTGGADLAASDIPNIATSKVNELTGYTKGSSSEALATTDTLNAALGKLENKSDSLKTRMDTAEGDISQLGTQISTLSSDSQVKSTADYQVGKSGGGWTTLDTNQVAAINSGATSALVGKISTNEQAINTLNGSGAGSVANSIASALTAYSTTSQMNAALDNKADKTTIGTVPENSTVMAEIAKAQNAATYNDTALKNRVAAIEESDAYTSGIDSTKVGQIATNTSDIAALQSGKQDKIDAQHKLSTDLIANDAGYITKDVNNLTNYTTTTSLNTSLSGKQPVSSGVSVGGANGSWNSLTNGSGITITTSDGTTTIATATSYVPMPSAAGTTGKSVLTYDSTANSGAGAYYWEEIGR